MIQNPHKLTRRASHYNRKDCSSGMQLWVRQKQSSNPSTIADLGREQTEHRSPISLVCKRGRDCSDSFQLKNVFAKYMVRLCDVARQASFSWANTHRSHLNKCFLEMQTLPSCGHASLLTYSCLCNFRNKCTAWRILEWKLKLSDFTIIPSFSILYSFVDFFFSLTANNKHG